MAGEESGGLRLFKDPCCEYVMIDPIFLDPTASSSEVNRIVTNVIAFVIDGDECAFGVVAEPNADNVWILRQALSWIEDKLGCRNADYRERILRLRECTHKFKGL